MSDRSDRWADILERSRGFASRSAMRPSLMWEKWLLEAEKTLVTKGVPTRKDEAWKYTDFRQCLPNDFTLGSFLAKATESRYLTSLHEALSSGYAADIMNLLKRSSEIESDGSVSLHSLLAQDGLVLRVPRNIKLSSPVWCKQQIVGDQSFQGSAALQVIWLEAGAQATYVEEVQSSADRQLWSSLATVIFLEEGAQLEFVRIQNLGREATQWGRVYVGQQAGSGFNGVIVQMGARFSRETVVAHQLGEGATTVLNGLSVGTGQQHVDLRTVVMHDQPQGVSEQMHRAIVAEKGRAVFNGRIFIAEGAQKVNSRQLTKSLILSPDAEVDTRPELDVRADDVKANHGASVGQLDAEQMFYLQSRGIPIGQAQEMLSTGFALEVVSGLSQASVRSRVRELLREKGIS